MSHAETEKKHNDAMALIVKQLRDYDKLLAFVLELALFEDMKDELISPKIDDMGDEFLYGKEVHEIEVAREARELLKEIGEAKDE